MSHFLLRSTLTAALIAVASTSGAAQSPAKAEASASPDTRARSAPTMMARRLDTDVAFRPVRQEVAPTAVRRQMSRPAVLMIVGGALIVTGILVGDDAAPILILAGAGIGGYGLYLHLQNPNARLRH